MLRTVGTSYGKRLGVYTQLEPTSTNLTTTLTFIERFSFAGLINNLLGNI